MSVKVKKILPVLIAVAIVLLMFPMFAFAQVNIMPFNTVLPPIGTIVLPLFFALMGAFALYSIILVYHWTRYAFGSIVVIPAFIIYFSVSAIIASAMLFAVSSLT